MSTLKKPASVKAIKATGGVAAKMAEVIRLRDEARKLFSKADEIESALLDTVVIGKAYKLPDGRLAAVVNNFADGKNPNIAWKSGMFRLYEVKTLK